MKYIYPTTIEELKDGDIIQTQYPLTDRWSSEKVFDINICCDKKENVKHLIENNRLRIVITNEKGKK